MTPDERASLREHLLVTGLSGDTRTPRSNVVSNAEKLADDDPDKALGLGRRGRDARGVMRAVAASNGCSASLDERDGPGVIDPDRTLDELHAMGDRLERAARSGERVLIATGHPTGVLAMYQAIARALADVGVELLRPIEDEPLSAPRRVRRPRRIRYLDGVAVLATPADLLHTHESWPMDAILNATARPSLVLADHGFAGAAIARGLDTVAFNDVNDPALAIAWEDGLPRALVPLDDNRPPGVYLPLAAYLTRRIPEGSKGATRPKRPNRI